ncbi:MAG: hypothetical protein IJ588_06205 [Prevotella sp.]|nr:hypothetical protein [Prevotella sp.]
MNTLTNEQVIRLFSEIEERITAIENYLMQDGFIGRKVVSAENKPKKLAVKEGGKCFSGHKTKYGTYIESAKKNWLTGILRNPVRTLYKETLFHSRCCLCQNEDVTVTSLTVEKKIKSQRVNYVIPLCEVCKAVLDNQKNSHKESRSIYWGAVIKTPFETNKRKF